MEGQNLSPITCRNCWSYSRDAFSPFCSKFKTCCFSDSAGNCYSWNKAVSHRLRPQPSLPFFFPQQKHSESLRARRGMDAALNPYPTTGAGGECLCNLQHILHCFFCRKGRARPHPRWRLEEILQISRYLSLPSAVPE